MLSNGVCLFYHRNKPMRLECRAGQKPTQLTFKGAGSSHISAFQVFKTRFPQHPLVGQIDLMESFEWMRSARENINYRDPQMNLDDKHDYFEIFASKSTRSILSVYIGDLPLYAFLPESAMIAYPIFAAEQAKTSLNSPHLGLTKQLIEQTLKRARDRNGEFNQLKNFQLK